ncbi:MAG: hypothetical protein COV35_07080 [Alphaproteobacteria bacterium CG11_big_fil_rev_8_21_14_0_20_39_49]|nr:MAG: hypothetical protein COV35_07080 [Alphaproteobacteria bacterium CG11_big_fil_rev_8_21_14_0_20_39_49]
MHSYALESISCKDYNDNINSLYLIFPKNISEESKCDMTPENCGVSGLFFNPDGMQAYYYKSKCYMKIAQKTLNEKYCDNVKERTSLFFDGSYFSKKSCLNKISRSKKRLDVTSANSDLTKRIETVKAKMHDKSIEVDIFLTDGYAGKYKITASASSTVGKVNKYWILSNEITEASYKEIIKGFYSTEDWVINLSEKQRIINFTIKGRYFKEFQELLSLKKDINFQIEITLIETDSGKAPPAEKEGVHLHIMDRDFTSKYIFSNKDIILNQ